MATFEFRCRTCGENHSGIPAFGWNYPIQYLVVPEAERATRCSLDPTSASSMASFFSFGAASRFPSSEHRMFGWLCSAIPSYPDTRNLKTMVHLRDDGIRPLIELEPTDHPLAVEQRNGISHDRVAELHETIVHGVQPAGSGAA